MLVLTAPVEDGRWRERRPLGSGRRAVGGEQVEPAGRLSSRLSRWAASDVLLVVEVSDETVAEDPGPKARLYGAAGYPVHWVVTREAVHEHPAPDASGYRTVTRHPEGDHLSLPHTGAVLTVADLVSGPEA